MKFLELARAINREQMLMERDVINAPDVKAWVKQLAQRATSPTGQQWVVSQVFDYLINKVEDREMVYQVQDIPAGSPDWLVAKMQAGSPLYQVQTTPEFATTVSGVIDWVNEWTQEHPGARINYTWEQAVKAADEWHKELAKGDQYSEEDPNDEGLATVKVYPDGMRWVIVRSKACLSREGGLMGHCVGGYYPRVEAGEVMILSLRSAKNTPHVTIELDEPRLDWWNEIIADLNRDQKQYQFDFMQYRPQDGDVIGKINQIKGKQNKAPVQKYVPYVTDLITNLPFEFTSGGKSDLSNTGWFIRNNKLVPLRDVAKTFVKYPTGYAWISVPEETQPVSSNYSVRYLLVDKSWSTLISTYVYVRNGEERSLSTHFSFTGDGTPYRDYIADFITKKQDSGLEFTDYAGTPTLSAAGVYIGANGVGSPDKASKFVRNLHKSHLQVYAVQSVVNAKVHQVRSKFNPVPTLFDGTGTPIGEVKIVDQYKDDPSYTGPGHRGINAGKAISGVTFAKPFVGDHQTLMIELSSSFGLPLQSPEDYGLDDNNTPVDVTEGAELLGKSDNRMYQYFLSPDRETIIVVGNDLRIPLARVEINTNENAIPEAMNIKSGLMDVGTDAGLFGYILIDLSKQDITADTLLNEYTMADRGWVEHYRDWIYAAGGSNLKVTVTTIITTAEGEETEEVTECLLHQVDESITGSESDAYLAVYASVIRNRTYSYGEDGYGNDGTESRDYVVNLEDTRATSSLDFSKYDRAAVEKLMR